MECRRMADGEAGATTSERGWATGTGQCLSRDPSPPNGLFHHPPPRSGFVQGPDSDVAARGGPAPPRVAPRAPPPAPAPPRERPQGPRRCRWRSKVIAREEDLAIELLFVWPRGRRSTARSEGQP